MRSWPQSGARKRAQGKHRNTGKGASSSHGGRARVGGGRLSGRSPSRTSTSTFHAASLHWFSHFVYRQPCATTNEIDYLALRDIVECQAGGDIERALGVA